MSSDPATKSYHPWGIAALSAAIFAGIVVFLVTKPFTSSEPNPSDTTSAAPAQSGATTTGSPVQPPSSTADRIQNLQLGIQPGAIPTKGGKYTTITVDDATPDAFVDIEIAQPSYVRGGVCRELTKGPCNLAYSGGDEADRDGHLSLKFPTQADVELHSGLYVITIRDRHTAAKVSIDLAVN